MIVARDPSTNPPLSPTAPGLIGPCILWAGSLTGKGYGRVYIGKKAKLAHRSIYENIRGPVPHGLRLDHLCRNRHCVNPSHLEPVTNWENTRRGIGPWAENHRKTHCVRGHPLSGENVYTRRGTTWRECKECNRAASARAKTKAKTAEHRRA